MKKSDLERNIAAILDYNNIEYVEEYRFHPTRRWRFDFAIPYLRIAIEAEGGVWSGGRHVRGSGFTLDCEKYNAATVLGWRVLRYPASAIGRNIIVDIKLCESIWMRPRGPL